MGQRPLNARFNSVEPPLNGRWTFNVAVPTIPRMGDVQTDEEHAKSFTTWEVELLRLCSGSGHSALSPKRGIPKALQ